MPLLIALTLPAAPCTANTVSPLDERWSVAGPSILNVWIRSPLSASITLTTGSAWSDTNSRHAVTSSSSANAAVPPNVAARASAETPSVNRLILLSFDSLLHNTVERSSLLFVASSAAVERFAECIDIMPHHVGIGWRRPVLVRQRIRVERAAKRQSGF